MSLRYGNNHHFNFHIEMHLFPLFCLFVHFHTPNTIVAKRIAIQKPIAEIKTGIVRVYGRPYGQKPFV